LAFSVQGELVVPRLDLPHGGQSIQDVVIAALRVVVGSLAGGGRRYGALNEDEVAGEI
jgi:hypothetical protein